VSVVSVTETAESRSGEDSFEKISGIVEISKGYTRSFVVETNDPEDGWEIVRQRLPALNSFYTSGNDTDLKALCTSRSGNQRADARKFWDCTCDYETDKADASGGGSDAENNDDGELKQTVRVSVEFMEYAALRDTSGAHILNAAKDPFDPPAMTQRPVIVYNITRYEQPNDFSLFGLVTYANSVNNDSFTIDGQQIDRGFGLFAGYDSQDVFRNGDRQKQVTYIIKVLPFNDAFDNPEGHDDFSLWDAELLQHGPNYIDSNGAKKPVVDSETGFRYNANLNKTTGAKLAVTADPQYSFYKIHSRQSFGSLGFK
jgi:hypothetical protein